MKILKIKSVKLHIIEASITPQGYSQEVNDFRDAAIIEIETDCGIVGWGESFFNPATINSIIELIVSPLLVGKNPYEWKSIRRSLFIATMRDGPHYGVISGIEIALLDIVGKDLGVSISQLFGGSQRESISVYATGCYRLQNWKSIKEITNGMMTEISDYIDAGFSTVKVKVGFSPSEDAIIVNNILREIRSEVNLAVDANTRWDLQSAIKFCSSVENHGIFFLEEPLPVSNMKGYLELKKKTLIPLACGEGIRALHIFRDYIQNNAIDIIQPDIIISGGFTVLHQVHVLSLVNNIRFIPHCWGSGISFAATSLFMSVLDAGLPWLTAINEPLMEFDQSENPLRCGLLKQPLSCVKGRLKVPTGPGLGIDVNRKFLSMYGKVI